MSGSERHSTRLFVTTWNTTAVGVVTVAGVLGGELATERLGQAERVTDGVLLGGVVSKIESSEALYETTIDLAGESMKNLGIIP